MLPVKRKYRTRGIYFTATQRRISACGKQREKLAMVPAGTRLEEAALNLEDDA
jgi:hypothetical protein